MSPESPLEIQLVVSAQSLATFSVSWPLTSGWADSALTVSCTLWLAGCEKGKAGQQRLTPILSVQNAGVVHAVLTPAGPAWGPLGCSLCCIQRLVFLLCSLPLFLFPLDQLHPLQVPLTQFLLISGQVLGLTCGEFLSHKLGGQSQETF